MSFGEIKMLAKRVGEAEEALRDALERDYPIGASVRCWIMHGQVNASTGEIIGHGPHSGVPTVRVRLNSRKHDVRDVPCWDVRPSSTGAK